MIFARPGYRPPMAFTSATAFAIPGSAIASRRPLAKIGPAIESGQDGGARCIRDLESLSQERAVVGVFQDLEGRFCHVFMRHDHQMPCTSVREHRVHQVQ